MYRTQYRTRRSRSPLRRVLIIRVQYPRNKALRSARYSIRQDLLLKEYLRIREDHRSTINLYEQARLAQRGEQDTRRKV